MEKLNIAELLKDCPSGMELDCLLWDNVTFERVADDGIWIKHIDSKSREHSLYVYNDGSFPIHNLGYLQTKCVIFPKGKTTWEGFQRPFKDGDIIYNKFINAVAIFNKQIDDKTISHCFLNLWNELKICHYHSKILHDWRFATEEEKQKLFDAIKENGYKWNPETKALENLKKDKFDITTLKPFDKVLVRGSDVGCWMAHLFSFYDTNCITIDPYKCISQHNGGYSQCIPYEGNEHLLGTTKGCDEYYKTW